MSDVDDDAINPPVCVNETGLPALSVSLPGGERRGWPLHVVLSWKLGARGKQIEISLASGEAVVATGVRLGEVVAILERGRGLEIKAFPDLFEPLSTRDQPFVASLCVVQQLPPE